MKEINIDIKNLMPAHIDDKNILVDSVMNTLFDDETYVFDKNEYMGFVEGFPTYVEHDDNKITVKYAGLASEDFDFTYWDSAIIEKLTLGERKELDKSGAPQRVQYIDDTPGVDTPYIMTFGICRDIVLVVFNWNMPKE